jgi:HAD superfamily hydrolase (TIGR01509 family)
VTPELVIFDCDGTLVDSESIANEALAQALTELGLPTTTEESLTTYKGRFLEDILAMIGERLGAPVPDGFWPAYEARRDAEFERRVRPMAGAHAAVAAVRAAGLRTCVASQAKASKTELTLGLTGLRDLFTADAVFSAFEVPRGKPFPDLFLYAAERMGASPSRSVVVEDTALGVRAGVAAGMRVFAVGEEAGGWAAEHGATPLARLADLPAALGLPGHSRSSPAAHLPGCRNEK